ncbi:M1 family metallopeptidase [Bacteroidota bacterium]
MHRPIALVLIFFVLFTSTKGQSSGLYIPLDIQKAYTQGTRSYDGNPGENYWQNRTDYKIKAQLLPDSSKLLGTANLTYYNNSPDTLRELVLRLYQNFNAKGTPRDWYIGTAELTDGVNIPLLIINGDTLVNYDERTSVSITGTNMTIRLEEPLAPNSNLDIYIEWDFYIPKIIRLRMGNYLDGEFFISYWYPQISVYDDIDGWDEISYKGNVEFYNDFNDYDVEIKLPGNYVVWAAGELNNSEDVFTESVIEKINRAKSSDEKTNIISPADYKNGSVTKDNKLNTWRFIAKNTCDFSFCVSDSYIWDAASVEVEPGRRVLTSVVYEDSALNYNEGAMISRETIEYMSKDLPGFPYPYSHVTTFSNKNTRGGGMETPMMANNGVPRSRAKFVGLTFHEISHTYFPFYMGTNERKYAWMDEGLAAFFPRENVDKHEPEYDYYGRRVSEYENVAGSEAEFPMMLLSYSNTGEHIRTAFYDRPAVAYNELMELLGRDVFKEALLEFMNRWKNKHPIPYDFFFTFNEIANEDLGWFWKPWFFEYGYPNLAIKSVNINNEITSVVIEKIGNIPTQVELTLIFEDDTKEKINKSSRVWKNNPKEIVLDYKSPQKIKKIELGSTYIPDSDRNNNIYELE